MIDVQANGKFRVRVATHIDGHYESRKQSNIATKGEARRIEQLFKAEFLILRERTKKGFITWEKAIKDHKEKCTGSLSPATLYDLDKYLTAHTSDWNNLTLDLLTRQAIITHVNKVMVDKSDESKDKLLKHIRAVFRTQVEQGVVSVNPVDGIRFTKKKKKFNELIAMSRPEIEMLFYEASQRQHPWYPIWYLTYQTGVRSMEGFELKWIDIDFHNSTLRISRAYCTKSKTVGPPKNREPRTIALNAETLAFLKELKLLRGNEEYVLPHFKEWEHGEAAKILRAFQRDIKIRETNFHSLRASFITHLLLSNVPVTKVQELVGHKELKTTQRYVRIVASDLKGSTDSIGIKNSPTKEAQVLEFPQDKA